MGRNRLLIVLIVLLSLTGDAAAQTVRVRATKKGMKIGAITGAASGLLLGGFAGLLVFGLCESGDCPESAFASTAVGAVLGTAFGTVSGGAFGAVIGASLTRHVPIVDANGKVAPPLTGMASLAPAFAHSQKATSAGSAGIRFNYAFQTEHLTFGPEIGWYGLGSNKRPFARSCPGNDPFLVCFDTIQGTETAFTAGGNARLGTGVSKRIEPYVSAGIGVFAFRRYFSGQELGGYSVGSGVSLRNEKRNRALFAEARWQSNLTRSGLQDANYGFSTFLLGGSVAW